MLNNKKIAVIFSLFIISSILIIFIFSYLPIRKIPTNNNDDFHIKFYETPPYFFTTGDSSTLAFNIIYNEDIIKCADCNITIYSLNSNSIVQLIQLTNINDTYNCYLISVNIMNKGLYSIFIEATWNGNYVSNSINNIYICYLPFSLSLIELSYLIILILGILVCLLLLQNLNYFKDKQIDIGGITTVLLMGFMLILFSIFIADFIGLFIGILIGLIGFLGYYYCKAIRNRILSMSIFSISIWMISCTILYILFIMWGITPFNSTTNSLNSLDYLWMIFFFLEPFGSIGLILRTILKYQGRKSDTECRRGM
ncbi:MAG: hypothetical protein ACTSPY_00475 [Candidatus Helarchaeota archaeon]